MSATPLIPAGLLGDRYGRKKTLLGGITIFDLLVDVLAERLGRSPADLEILSFVAAILAVYAWVENDGRGDLLGMLDRGIAFLVAGCPL